MPRHPAQHRTRSLRFRLTASYALLFTLLLIAMAALFHGHLKSSLDAQAHDVLTQEWAAMKGYLQILPDKQPRWFFDRDDPDEAYIVEQIRRVYLLTDGAGHVLECSTVYQSLGCAPKALANVMESQAPHWSEQTNAQGVPFLIRAGVVYDERHKLPYYIAIGRSLAANHDILREYTWIYAGIIPAGLICGCLMGWFLAGRALTPVKEVARAAQRISGSNLSLRIPTRGAGDELDYLIQTFNRMIDRLERSFQQIRQFSTDVSHELRTPITAIRGQLEVALFTAQTTEQYRDAILNALQDTERLSQIVRALLLLSQAESGQVALQKTRLDLAAVARDVVEQFQIPAEESRVRLAADLAPGCYVDADPIQIERMLSNLLSNAIKFTPGEGEVRVALQCAPEQVEIAIDDTGCGIPPEHLPHIFERFYRVPEAASRATSEKGLGLGLSFVAWIAEAHGGSVRVTSELGKGSCFSVILPLAAAENRAEAPGPGVGLGMNKL